MERDRGKETSGKKRQKERKNKERERERERERGNLGRCKEGYMFGFCTSIFVVFLSTVSEYRFIACHI